jgi:hypothetical protein
VRFRLQRPGIADDIAAFAGTKKGITYSNQLDIVRRLAYRLTIQASDPAFIKRWDRSETAGTVRRDGDTA